MKGCKSNLANLGVTSFLSSFPFCLAAILPGHFFHAKSMQFPLYYFTIKPNHGEVGEKLSSVPIVVNRLYAGGPAIK